MASIAEEDSVLRYSVFWEGGLKPGNKLTIIGRVNSNLGRFAVNLCKDVDGKEVSLHFNPRFAPAYQGPHADVVVRNSKSLNTWGREELWGPTFPFKKGEVFKLEILCQTDRFDMSVDGTSFGQYMYRAPLQGTAYLRINGGVSIMHVCPSL